MEHPLIFGCDRQGPGHEPVLRGWVFCEAGYFLPKEVKHRVRGSVAVVLAPMHLSTVDDIDPGPPLNTTIAGFAPLLIP